jgi:hypothetical protein
MGCPNYPCALKTVDELKVDAYTGRWFQVGGDWGGVYGGSGISVCE